MNGRRCLGLFLSFFLATSLLAAPNPSETSDSSDTASAPDSSKTSTERVAEAQEALKELPEVDEAALSDTAVKKKIMKLKGLRESVKRSIETTEDQAVKDLGENLIGQIEKQILHFEELRQGKQKEETQKSKHGVKVIE